MVCAAVAPALTNQGPYLVHGEQKQESALRDRTAAHDHQGDAKQLHQRPSQLSARSSTRCLTRQDTFDSETPGSQDLAYTEPADSSMDIEMDPCEEPELETHGHRAYRAGVGYPCQSSWDELGPEQKNQNRQPKNRNRLREHYCQNQEGVVARNKNDVESWDRDVYIR
ncbi:voltage-dependent L-type calcium channel subunit beta-1-like [Rhinatrema bivittatum]|uniref:voltage-dependent L-type calcium channel subunit beta-1-like n=1 Tax=Rhinatrema bivittatum TaxID=194408 RepID=UPI00112DE3E0|nr:voltage-dependent L-type calcium channel subunit beta-1-like [Rhinatrema bivittatum]